MNQARQIAVDTLNRVEQGRHTLDHWLDQAAPRIQRLGRNDRALVHALVYGVLRWKRRLDWMIDQLANRPAKTIDPPVRTILRIGLFQLFYLDRVPASAVVNTSVELIKQAKRPWAAGFANKLLRRAAKDTQWTPSFDEISDPIEALAIEHALPSWLVARWLNRLGIAEAQQLCHALNQVPGMTIRTNTLKTTRHQLIDAVLPEADCVSPARYTLEGVDIAGLHRPIDQWPTFHDGWFQVQDESAQLVSQLLSPRAGMIIWDACAGLGTKTTHLAQLMNNQGSIMASDVQPAKLRRLKVELMRLGIQNTSLCALDLNSPAPYAHRPIFDRILVDAPCSGLGVLQKNPDGKWSSSEGDLIRHQQRQILFLSQVAPWLKPGGILVYSVCSFEPEENEQVIEEFLRKQSRFDIHPAAMVDIQNRTDLMTPDHFMRIWPHRHPLSGFFAAAMIKR